MRLRYLCLSLLLIASFVIYSEVVIYSDSVLTFSPNSDGVLDNCIIMLESEDNIESIQLLINDDAVKFKNISKEQHIYTAIWDGVIRGKKIKDGQYNTTMSIKSSNGVEVSKSIIITSDTQKPRANISAKVLKLSPNYDGVYDFLKVEQSGSLEKLWIGEIVDKNNRVVKSYNWKKSSPRNFKWDGFTNYKRVALDGDYSYKLYSVDEAGNKSDVQIIHDIELDASAPKVDLEVDNAYLSPNNDGIKDVAKVLIDIEGTDKVIKNELILKNDKTKNEISIISNTTNKQFIFTGVKSDGTPIENGFHSLILKTEYKNGYIAYDSLRINIFNTPPNVDVGLVKEFFYLTKEGNRSAEIVLNSILLSENIIERWAFNILDGDNISVYEEIGSEDIPKSLAINLDNLKQQNYSLNFWVTDRNGNKSIFNKEFSSEVDLFKKDGKLYLNTKPIFFEPYSAVIENYDFSLILPIIKKYTKHHNIVLESHAFDDGTNTDKLKLLAENRGENVKIKLVEYGINSEKLLIRNMGISKNNQKNSYSAQLRRVDFLVD